MSDLSPVMIKNTRTRNAICLNYVILWHCMHYIWQVLERILAGMVPRLGGSLVDKLSPSPDLYGPFWLAMTLTLTVALSSNLSRLIQLVVSFLSLSFSSLMLHSSFFPQKHRKVGISFSRSDTAWFCDLCLLIFYSFSVVVCLMVEGK